MLKKKTLLGRPAVPIIYILTAKSLMYYGKITLSALHLVDWDTTIK